MANGWGGARSGAGRPRGNKNTYSQKRIELRIADIKAQCEVCGKPNKWLYMLQHSNIRVFNNRRVITYQHRNYPYATILWNLHYPSNPVQRGELIHHKDGNSMNDIIDNYEKLTKSKHMTLHNNRIFYDVI